MADALQSVWTSQVVLRGAFRAPPAIPAWKDHEAVVRGVPGISDRARAATQAYLDYVWDEYGRFPVQVPPFRCGLAHQVVHVDAEFYDRFYQPEALSDRQRDDFAAHVPPSQDGPIPR